MVHSAPHSSTTAGLRQSLHMQHLSPTTRLLAEASLAASMQRMLEQLACGSLRCSTVCGHSQDEQQ